MTQISEMMLNNSTHPAIGLIIWLRVFFNKDPFNLLIGEDAHPEEPITRRVGFITSKKLLHCTDQLSSAY